MTADRSNTPPHGRRGGRYSRFVRLMKLALPSAAVLVMGLVLAWPQVQNQVDRLGLDLAYLNLLAGNPSSIVNPRYFGVDERNQPYSVTAARAEERSDGSGLIDLTEPSGDIELDGERWISVRGDAGVYSREDGTVVLEGDVVMYRDDGVQFFTESARYDLETRQGQSDVPIEGRWSNGVIESEDGFRMFDGGGIILFKGQAHMILHDVAGRITP